MVNSYATLADFKANATARGQTMTTDTADDAVIEGLLESASRYLDLQTSRQFYPSVTTRLFDIPQTSTLFLDDDLLELTTLTNGDGTTINSTNYILLPSNTYPRFGIELKSTSGLAWLADSSSNTKQVISVAGVWGFRQNYTQRGWVRAGTLGAAISDTTTLAFTMTAGHTLVQGMIVKIDSELYNLSTVVTNTITPVQRGDNGSTAATHLNGAVVYYWVPDDNANLAVIDQATSDYDARFSNSNQQARTATEFNSEGITGYMRHSIGTLQRP
jgi:hypothetical protein